MRVIYSRIIITRSWLCARLEEEVRARERAPARVCVSLYYVCALCRVCVRVCVCLCACGLSPLPPARRTAPARSLIGRLETTLPPLRTQRGAAKTSSLSSTYSFI